MMKLYQSFPVDEETPVQWLAVHPLRWRPGWGEPAIMFREVDDKAQALCDAAPAMLKALKKAHYLIGAITESDPTQEILWTDIDKVRTAIAAAIAAAEPNED